MDLTDTPDPPPRPKRPIAVALKHDRGEIPVVVASGKGLAAEKILELAFAAGVKVREDADLVELLAAVELECPIPVNCFDAVAEILSYLYRLNQTVQQGPTT